MRVSTLVTFLGTSNLTVSTANAQGTGEGAIHVISPFQVPQDRTLTLDANAGIHLNANITGLNGSALVLHTTAGDITQSAPLSVQFLTAQADAGAVLSLIHI